ncbi:UTRA domain-containing protein [Dyella flava]|uniref:UTRA domain-containing protein n=2 Tax=Dyella flava TaxID=1920170 RepID=A0ABS2K0N2_9GAMM|nr:UTRA domain-containing protein [Dyella flava]GLQ50842.1 hypothetical protein GCM10010872_22910 [Dyella flava]
MLPDPHEVHDSLYEALEKCNSRPIRALQRLRAALPRARQARLPHVTPRSAELHIERRGFLEDGRVVEFTTPRYRGNIHDFVAELQAD